MEKFSFWYNRQESMLNENASPELFSAITNPAKHKEVIDIVDDLIYGKKHYAKRKEFYEIEKIKITEKSVSEKA